MTNSAAALKTRRLSAGNYEVTVDGRTWLVQRADETDGWIYGAEDIDESMWAGTLGQAKQGIACTDWAPLVTSSFSW